ncbi:EAL domain-containing response regulator [Methylotuvimicrobium alcaliphilum]|uniref:cyclic-guanylate-specific phosphodiesterase n=1 Tax=Methylotuvimicrobium alcaliphilum (strain DSM 19304 / NCIMB 14124 / VKM B-2133 / 20Z) TaxID=1091494 RepID=G4T2S7_META2
MTKSFMERNEVLRILIVEDVPVDAELMVLQLKDDGLIFDWQRVQNEEDFLQALDTRPDLILTDWCLPQFSGLKVLELLHNRDNDIPVVVVSGSIGEEIAIDALQKGAFDYVLKDRPARLGAAIRHALEEKELRDERKRYLEKLRLADQVFESTGEGIIVTDIDANIVAVNPAFEQITGYTKIEVLGKNPSILKSNHQDRSFFFELWNTLLGTGHWRGEVWNRRKNGEVYPEWLTISAVKNSEGTTTHFVGVFNDISSVKEAQAQLDFLAHHDALTRLPNRTLFRDRLEHALIHAQRENKNLAVLFLDLDRFKTINDTLGHPVGDDLLKQAADRMQQAIRADDTLARLGGDEFVLLLEDDSTAHHAVIVAHKLLQIFNRPMFIEDHTLTVTASIGIALFPQDGKDVDTLLKHADLAMYQAKQQGRNTYQFFSSGLTTGAFERLIMENALRGAVARNELLLYYQPQINLIDRTLAGVEALVRWQHAELGIVSPGQFIPLAEDMGIIAEIGEWVLNEAVRQMAEWQAEGFDVPRVSVNLSMQQIDREDLAGQVSAALERMSIPAKHLELEVTESMIMRQPDQAMRILDNLRQQGILLSIDDFGTGYSSLAYLKNLPLDRLKIDQSFVQDIGRDEHGEAIVRVIIALARNLGLEAVAEGVESEEQAQFLEREGCNIAQGYLFAHPMPADELIRQSDRYRYSGEKAN